MSWNRPLRWTAAKTQTPGGRHDLRDFLARLQALPCIRAIVRQTTARIKASPFIPKKDKIRGFVYDVKTGRLDEVAERVPAAMTREA